MEAEDAVPPLQPDLGDYQMVNDPANLTPTSPHANVSKLYSEMETLNHVRSYIRLWTI